MTTNYHDFEADDEMFQLNHVLALQAQQFEARNEPIGGGRCYLIIDGEYKYHREAYDAYRAAEGKEAAKKTRWPFHRLAAVSWVIMRFTPGKAAPELSAPVVLTLDAFDEKEMTRQVLAALAENPDATLVSWGGECKDFSVLRQNASSFGLKIPSQLLPMSPYCRERLDLCLAVSGMAANVHLPEMAFAVGIPTKPSPSVDIGPLVVRGKWPEVRDQVLADVLTTAVIMVRHLSAFGQIDCDQEASILALAEAAQTSHPSSDFVRRTFQPWAKAKCVRAGLRGLVEAA